MWPPKLACLFASVLQPARLTFLRCAVLRETQSTARSRPPRHRRDSVSARPLCSRRRTRRARAERHIIAARPVPGPTSNLPLNKFRIILRLWLRPPTERVFFSRFCLRSFRRRGAARQRVGGRVDRVARRRRRVAGKRRHAVSVHDGTLDNKSVVPAGLRGRRPDPPTPPTPPAHLSLPLYLILLTKRIDSPGLRAGSC